MSVVIPVHDVEPWLPELLQSVRNQGIDDMEIIVVDDGSRDASRVIAEDVASFDSRVVVVRAERPGGAHARNQGAQLASGQFLVFADGDDLVPRGAYQSLLAALLESGSDVAVGDYLKFSASRTWRPTARWPDWQSPRRSARIEQMPSLIRGRACWNRMFRRAFWQEAGISFPEVPRSNDIVPMTAALLAATAIDVVDDCVYLYRERPGQSSMTAQAGADRAAVSYFRQEAICAEMVVRSAAPELELVYSALVFDSDAWVHLSRYLLGLPEDAPVPVDVLESLRQLIAAVPRTALDLAAAHRRVLFALVEIGELAMARRFNAETARASGDAHADMDVIRAWVEATTRLGRAAVEGLSVGKLVNDGILTVLVNDAHRLGDVELQQVVALVNDSALVRGTLEGFFVESSALRAVAAALRQADTAALRAVSEMQSATPLVIDAVESRPRSVRVAGPVPPALRSRSLGLVALGQFDDSVLLLGDADRSSPDRWSFTIADRTLARTRYELRAVVRASADIDVEVAVVTARMPVPPVGVRYELQALSDRRRSWRFIVERRGHITSRVARAAWNTIRSRLSR